MIPLGDMLFHIASEVLRDGVERDYIEIVKWSKVF